MAAGNTKYSRITRQIQKSAFPFTSVSRATKPLSPISTKTNSQEAHHPHQHQHRHAIHAKLMKSSPHQ